MPPLTFEDIAVPITAEQTKYLAGLKGFAAEGPGAEPTDVVITQRSPDGWLFVENAANLGEDGSGVWVDVQGNERYGPTGDNTFNDETGEWELPLSVRVMAINKPEATKIVADALEEDARVKGIHFGGTSA